VFGFLPGGNPHAEDGSCLGPAEPGWFYGARAFVDQLRDFLQGEDPSVPDHQADMVQAFTDAGPHDDIFAFLPARQWGRLDGGHAYHLYSDDLLLREAAELGYGPTVEVPPYNDPSGPLQTVDLRAKLDSLRTATTDSEERRLVRELAWTVNETVPYLQGNYRPVTAYVDAADWSVGDADAPTAPLADPDTLSKR